jgi:large conductance mechanosensitive channel
MNPVKAVSGIAPAKNALSLVEEFKKFAFKGNVIDMAVGIIIGAAFGGIIKSLVDNIIMPLVALVMPGEKGYLAWKLVVGAKEVPYGLFIGEVANFLIVAAALFIFIVKFLGWLMKSRQKAVAAPAAPLALAPTKDQELLAEILDLLKNRN